MKYILLCLMFAMLTLTGCGDMTETIESIEFTTCEDITTTAETTVPETTEELPEYYPFSYADVEAMAKMVYGEAQTSPIEQKYLVCVVALNHYDHYKDSGYSLYDVVTDRNQFNAYRSSNPVTNEIWEICIEAIQNYNAYKNHEDICWQGFYWFHSSGDGVNNVFR